MISLYKSLTGKFQFNKAARKACRRLILFFGGKKDV